MPRHSANAPKPDEAQPDKPPPPAEPAPAPTEAAPPEPDAISELFNLDVDSATDSDIESIVNGHVGRLIAKNALSADHNVLFLYDSTSISRTDADRIYRALANVDPDAPLLLIVTSPGGDVAAAYLIAKLCRENARDRFEVVVPRQAKSAATLIACGADRIHMGSLSELGPIDPQFGQIPALALKNSVEHLATLAQSYPQAAEMFASYLSKSLRVEALGFYERVAESAMQYAIRLLDKRETRGSRSSSEIASMLVYDYKDHGFVIDAAEATEIFGDEVVVTNTPEYRLGNEVYEALKLFEWLIPWRFSRDMAFTGDVSMACAVRRRRQE